MGSSELRRRLLLAMGLPMIGCGGARQEGPPPPPPWEGKGSGTSVGDAEDGEIISNEAPTYVAGAPCAVDQIPESVCGAVSGSAKACGPTGDALTSYGNSALYVTQGSYGAHDRTFADFVLDAEATKHYQDSLRASQLQLPLDEYCCYSSCTTLQVATSAKLDVPAGFHAESTCIPAPPAGTNVPSAAAAECPAAVMLFGELLPHDGQASYGNCCYHHSVMDEEEPRHNRGRPARIDGEARVAPVAAVAGWSAPVSAGALDPAVRARLAAAWTVSAQMEHASIAAFAHLALRLMAAGAPPELLAAAHLAALDEIEHARISFALATAYAGAPVGPAPFTELAGLGASPDVTALALETFVDGCIGETVAACEARWAASRCADPDLAATLARIAEDETRHAELAWAIVAWAVRREPALVARLTRALSDARTSTPREDNDDDLSAHGVLSARDLAALRRDVIATVVTPCLEALGSPDRA